MSQDLSGRKSATVDATKDAPCTQKRVAKAHTGLTPFLHGWIKVKEEFLQESRKGRCPGTPVHPAVTGSPQFITRKRWPLAEPPKQGSEGSNPVASRDPPLIQSRFSQCLWDVSDIKLTGITHLGKCPQSKFLLVGFQ